MLGLVRDQDEVAESVADDFAGLTASGRSGELYVRLPQSIALAEVVTVLDGGSYPDKTYPETYVYHKLWTPGTDPNSYTDHDLGNAKPSAYPAHGRLAVHNPANSQEPLLHFLNQPYDAMYAKPGQQTQLEDDVAESIATYSTEGHTDLSMDPLTVRDVALIALVRRIKGEIMPMAWGFMRDPTLPRRTVDGGSVVGYVDSRGCQLRLGGSGGDASPDVGVGLSVGLTSESLATIGYVHFA